MAKFRPKGSGRGRFPRRSGGSKGNQLALTVNAVTESLQTQRQAWTEVIASLNEYRAIELPDVARSAPDISGWQALTAEVKAYSAAIAAIQTPTVARFTPPAASSQQPQAAEPATVATAVLTADPSEQIAALNAVDAEIDDQGSRWTALADIVTNVVDGAVAGFGEIVATSITAADAVIDQHAAHWLKVSQSIAESVTSITATIEELASVPAPAVSGSGEAPTDSSDIITATTDAIVEQTAAWQELATSTATAAESTAASVVAMQELVAAAAQTQSSLESVTQTNVSSSAASREQVEQTMTVVRRSEASWGAMATTAIGALTVIGQGVMLFAKSKNALTVANVNATIAETTLATATMNASAARAMATAAIGGQTAATLFAIPPTFTLAGAMAVLTAPITLIVGGLALAAGALYYFTRSSEEATEATRNAGDAAEDGAKKAGSLSLAYEAVAEQAENITAATKETGSGLTAMQTATQSLRGGFFPDDTEEQLQSVAKEAGKVVVAWGELKATLAQPVIDAGMALGRYAAELLGVKSAAESATATLKLAGDALEWAKGKSKEYTTALAVMAHMMATGSTEAEAKAYVEQGQKILETSARIEAMTARLEEQRQGYAGYRRAVEDATASAAHGAEMNRIGSITTLAGIEAERAAIGRKAATEIEANAKRNAALAAKGAPKDEISAETSRQDKATEQRVEKLKKLAELEQGIKSGRVETDVDAATRKTTEAIRELTLGHTENTIEVMRAEAAQRGQLAAFEAGLPAYREAQAQLAAVKEATEQTKKTQDDLARSSQKVADANTSAAATIETVKDKIAILNGTMTEAGVAMKAMQAIGINPEIANEAAKVNAEFERLTTAKKGTDQITALKDQIDLLNGAATAAQIKMRELGREGFSEEQVAQIGSLTAELDRLKESQKKGGKDKQTDNRAAFAGSKEAAEIMLRGVAGNRMESVADQQLAEQKRIAAAVEKQAGIQPKQQAAVVPQLAVPPMPAPAAISPAVAPAPAVAVALPVANPAVVPPVVVTPQPSQAKPPQPTETKQAVQATRIVEAEAARNRAEKAASRAGLNPEQVAEFGQSAWEKSERETAPRMGRFQSGSPSPQIPTVPPTVPTAAPSPVSISVPQSPPINVLPMATPSPDISAPKITAATTEPDRPKPQLLASLPTTPQNNVPVADQQSARFAAEQARLSAAEAARDRAIKAAADAGLNPQQVAQFGDDAWATAERASAPKQTRNETATVATTSRPTPTVPQTLTTPATAGNQPQALSPTIVAQTPARPQSLVAPVADIKPFAQVSINPPEATVGNLPNIGLPAPAASVKPLPAVAMPSPSVFVASVPPVGLSAPATTVKPLSAVSLAAPAATVEPLRAQSATSPQVSALPPMRIAPPVVTVQPLPQPSIAMPAPTVERSRQTPETLSAVSLPPSQPIERPTQAAIVTPATAPNLTPTPQPATEVASRAPTPSTQFSNAPQPQSTPSISVNVPQSPPINVSPMASQSVAVNVPQQVPQQPIQTQNISIPQTTASLPDLASLSPRQQASAAIKAANAARDNLVTQINVVKETRRIEEVNELREKRGLEPLPLPSIAMPQPTRIAAQSPVVRPPLVPPAASLNATATPAIATAAPVSIPVAAAITIPKVEFPRNDLPQQRAGVSESPKVSGVSDRVTEPRRSNHDKEIVDVLRQILQEEKLTTSAIRELEMPDLQVGTV